MKVAEAWNNEKCKRNYEAPKPLQKEQHEISKTLGTCQCWEHYGHLCLQEDSLMTAEARQRYPSEINRKLSAQDPVLEGVTQAEDRNPTINLEDLTITFKEYQLKKKASSLRNKLVKQAKKSWSYRNHWQVAVLNPVSTNHSLKLFNPRMTTLSRRIMMRKELWWSRKIAQMDVLLFHVNRVIFHNSVATIAS